MKLKSDEFRALFSPQLNKLSDLFMKYGYELRIAGGAVRDLLMNIRPADVDFASTATPQQMKDLFEREQIRMLNKRGEEHGTITCRIDDAENFEITTLRVDLVCDGRRAEVQYTTDWQLDANRRDLTINSLFLDLDGTVVDYFGGIDDVLRRKVRFVGDAAQRIQEDYLRILRYFRFFGRIAVEDSHDASTVDAIRIHRDGLLSVSAERIWTEMKKIVVGRMAPQVLRCMLSECGLHKHVGLPEDAALNRFQKVFEKYSEHVEPMTMVGTLCNRPEDIALFHAKTKLSNVERVLGEFVVGEREKAEAARGNVDYWRGLIIDLDVQPGHDKHPITGRERVLQLAMSICMDENELKALRDWEMPNFPIKGVDLMNSGVGAGPKMRSTLQYLYDLWKKSKYEMSREALLSHREDDEIPEPSVRANPKKRRREKSS